MSPVARGMLVCVIHLGIVLSLGAKLLWDRSTRPRVWARAQPFDPNLPIRGRYVRLQLEADVRGQTVVPYGPVLLSAENGRLMAAATTEHSGVFLRSSGEGHGSVGPVAYFIPEHVADPSRRQPGEELWVEVTVPMHGPPRPIRLGVKKGEEEIVPLALD